MTHPTPADLALYAGQDLGWFARRRIAHHVARCPECRDEVDAFARSSEDLVQLNELPPLSWNRMAAEMKANIRLGLSAGECVRSPGPVGPLGWLSSTRALTACACALALLAAGLYIERPSPTAGPAASAAARSGAVLRSTANSIELDQGGQTLILRHDDVPSVTYAAGAQGSMRAGYVDADGQVTINDVYVQ